MSTPLAIYSVISSINLSNKEINTHHNKTISPNQRQDNTKTSQVIAPNKLQLVQNLTITSS